MTSGYQIDFYWQRLRKNRRAKIRTVIVPDVEHNTSGRKQNSHNLSDRGYPMFYAICKIITPIPSIRTYIATTLGATPGSTFVYPDHFEYSDRCRYAIHDTELARLKSIQGKSTHPRGYLYEPRSFLAVKTPERYRDLFLSHRR
ncbi:hypothetical protein KCP74_24880 [Salmonella enterica subsp. enterica]|nr:hypothetical protein KCP74_24880 [Salmonella enterica subsp. enterica]